MSKISGTIKHAPGESHPYRIEIRTRDKVIASVEANDERSALKALEAALAAARMAETRDDQLPRARSPVSLGNLKRPQ